MGGELVRGGARMQVLSGHKETPKFFWGKPDNLQVIYHAVRRRAAPRTRCLGRGAKSKIDQARLACRCPTTSTLTNAPTS